MFESAPFLALYLPKHFNTVFSTTEQTFEQFDPRFFLSFTQFVSMCQSLHYSSTSRLYLYTFLIKCFLKKSHENLLVSPSMLDIENLVDTINSNFGETNYSGVEILILSVLTDLVCSERNDENLKSVQKRQLLLEKILSSMQKLKFQLEALRLLNGSDRFIQDNFSFDKYMQVLVIFLIEQWKICATTSKLLIDLFRQETANLSDSTQNQLIKKLKRNISLVINTQSKKPGIIQTASHQNSIKPDSPSQQNNPLLSKHAPKFKKTQTPKKTAVRRPLQPQNNRLDSLLTFKHKPIMKSRTIHQSRKCVFVPKGNQNSTGMFNQKMEFSTQNSIDFTTIMQHPMRCMSYSNEMQDENILVGSTPKPAKFLRKFEEITKKLNFNQD